jgi:hypothetical protein
MTFFQKAKKEEEVVALNPNPELEESKRSQDIEKQRELLRVLTMTLIQKTLEANQEKMILLNTKESNLRSSLKELSARIEPAEVVSAKVAVTNRKIEEGLASGKFDQVESLRQELLSMAENLEKLRKELDEVSSQIEQVAVERKALLTPIFRETFDQIKLGLAAKLSSSASWADRELQEFIGLMEQYGIRLHFNVESEMRLFRGSLERDQGQTR